jgi:uncharacterized protein (TIGR03067 family)
MRRLGLVVVAVGLLAGADQPQAAKSNEDVGALQGRWTMVSLIIKGDPVPQSLVGPGTLVVEGVDYRLNLGSNSAVATIKVDASKTPRAIDFTFTAGPQKGETVRGIFKIEDNTLTVCRGLTEGDDRPTTFASPADSGLLLVVWKRSEADAATRAELAKLQGTWQLVWAETEGKKTDEAQVKQIRVTINGSSHTVRFGDKVIVHDVAFNVDPTRTPHWTTDTINDGPDKGKQILGIYRLDGDTLTSCAARVGEARPTEFASKPGSGQTVRVFYRAIDDPAKARAVAEELAKFEGTWTFASMEFEGQEIPAKDLADSRLICKGNEFTAKTGEGTTKGTFQVDPTASPKTIDVTMADGADKGKTLLGIYTLTADTYRVSLAGPGKPRPTEFVSKAGSGNAVETLKKEKP